MKITAVQYAEAFYQTISETRPEDNTLVINNLINILKQNDDLELYQAIIDEFEKLTQLEQDKVKTQITTAREVGPNSKLMKEIHTIFGNNSEIKNKVDSGIVGGIMLQIGDELLDASIKKQLSQLHDTLTK